MKKIKLQNTKDMYTIVDDDTYEDLNKYKCNAHYSRENSIPCAQGRVFIKGKKVRVRMHRYIMLVFDREDQVDHKNLNPLDNRRENLRVCTNLQNQMNRGPRRGSSSKYKGVQWDKGRNRWKAGITIKGKLHFIGRYLLEKEAAKMYDEIYRNFK